MQARKAERIDLRLTPAAKSTLQQAAAQHHKTVSEFLIESGLNAAQEALMERQHFLLDDEQWEAFLTALDRDDQPKPRLEKLLSEKSVFE